MTGVQTCALPICFPVTIQTSKSNNRSKNSSFNLEKDSTQEAISAERVVNTATRFSDRFKAANKKPLLNKDRCNFQMGMVVFIPQITKVKTTTLPFNHLLCELRASPSNFVVKTGHPRLNRALTKNSFTSNIRAPSPTPGFGPWAIGCSTTIGRNFGKSIFPSPLSPT